MDKKIAAGIIILSYLTIFGVGYILGTLPYKRPSQSFVSEDNFMEELPTDSIHPSATWSYKDRLGRLVIGYTPVKK